MLLLGSVEDILIEESAIMSENNMPKGAQFRHVQLPVKTKSNIPNEQGGYGSLRVFVRTNGEPYTAVMAKRVRSFLVNQKIIDEKWGVIKWGNGFAVAPIKNDE
jgi:hypothetical protein